MDFVNVLAVFVTSLQQHIEHLVTISNKLLSTIAQSVCVNYLQIANTQAIFSFSNMIKPGCLHKRRTLSWFYRWQIAWYILLLLSYISSFVSMTHSRITCLFFFFCCCFLTPLGLGLVTESTAKLVHFNSQQSSESPLEKREPSFTMQLERVLAMETGKQ